MTVVFSLVSNFKQFTYKPELQPLSFWKTMNCSYNSILRTKPTLCGEFFWVYHLWPHFCITTCSDISHSVTSEPSGQTNYKALVSGTGEESTYIKRIGVWFIAPLLLSCLFCIVSECSGEHLYLVWLYYLWVFRREFLQREEVCK